MCVPQNCLLKLDFESNSTFICNELNERNGTICLQFVWSRNCDGALKMVFFFFNFRPQDANRMPESTYNLAKLGLSYFVEVPYRLWVKGMTFH